MKKAHVCRQTNVCFFLAEKERFSSRTSAALHCCGARKNHRAYAILDFFDRSHSSRSLHPPPAAVAFVPLAGARVQIFSDPTTQKAHLAVCFSLMEKERYKADLFSRYSVGVYLVCFRKAVQNCVRSEKPTSAATAFTESEVFRKSVFATFIFSCTNA